MDLGTKNANNLISKDNNVSRSAASDVINYKDIETFERLSEKSEFIFDFIKEKIISNLLDATNKQNYRNILAFTNTYNADFEDFVVQGLVRHASEELTDELLELFENGFTSQKTYCAGYFMHIKDPVCIELLNKYALSDFAPLAANCAKALFGFGERRLYNEMLDKLQSDAGDFEKLEAVNFLVSYGDVGAFDSILEYMQKSGFPQNIAAEALTLKPFSEMDEKTALLVFDYLLDAYPEILPLATLSEYEILEFIERLPKMPKTSYRDRIILKTKVKFDLISQNDQGDIYTYDLDKNTKALVLEIQKHLNTLGENYTDSLPKELLEDEHRALEALDVILELNLKQFAQNVAELAKTSKDKPMLLCESVKTLKSLGALNLANKDEIEKNLKDENVLALLDNYFN